MVLPARETRYPNLASSIRSIAAANEHRGNRLVAIANRVLAAAPGSLFETGAGGGHITSILAPLCPPGHAYVAVEPFTFFDGRDQHAPSQDYHYGYEQFLKNTKDYTSHIKLIKTRSQDPEARQALLNNRPVTFAFIDGEISYEARLQDVLLCAEAEVLCICVDDWGYGSHITVHNYAHPYHCEKDTDGNCVQCFTKLRIDLDMVQPAVYEFLRRHPEYELLTTDLFECYLLRKQAP